MAWSTLASPSRAHLAERTERLPYDANLPPCRHEIAARRRWPTARWPRPAGSHLAERNRAPPVRRQRSPPCRHNCCTSPMAWNVGLANDFHRRVRNRAPARDANAPGIVTNCCTSPMAWSTLASLPEPTWRNRSAPARTTTLPPFGTKLLQSPMAWSTLASPSRSPMAVQSSACPYDANAPAISLRELLRRRWP